jgi:hypothetical protein
MASMQLLTHLWEVHLAQPNYERTSSNRSPWVRRRPGHIQKLTEYLLSSWSSIIHKQLLDLTDINLQFNFTESIRQTTILIQSQFGLLYLVKF